VRVAATHVQFIVDASSTGIANGRKKKT